MSENAESRKHGEIHIDNLCKIIYESQQQNMALRNTNIEIQKEMKDRLLAIQNSMEENL